MWSVLAIAEEANAADTRRCLTRNYVDVVSLVTVVERRVLLMRVEPADVV